MDALLTLANTLRIPGADIALVGDVGSDEHGDAAVQNEQTETLMLLLQNEGKTRTRVLHAIDMARHGLRGVCEDCEKKIPAARLEAVPYATRCVKCEENAEGA